MCGVRDPRTTLRKLRTSSVHLLPPSVPDFVATTVINRATGTCSGPERQAMTSTLNHWQFALSVAKRWGACRQPARGTSVALVPAALSLETYPRCPNAAWAFPAASGNRVGMAEANQSIRSSKAEHISWATFVHFGSCLGQKDTPMACGGRPPRPSRPGYLS